MALPLPTEYEDWRDWASAMLQVLTTSDNEVVAGAVTTTGPASAPPGYAPLWLNLGLPELYAGNVYGSAPVAGDIVYIDTAEIAAAAITGTKIADGAVGTSHIVDAAIVTAKIGDLQVVTAKMGDLSVNNAKIANLAVASANIMDAAINNAKIGALAVGTANIIDLNVTTAKIGLLAVTAAQIANATIVTANIGAAQITTALIQNAAIVQALIAVAAIGTAQIQDAAINSAKVDELVVDKLSTGTLDAVIDVGTGILRFTIGGFRMSIGKGFGTLGQFIMWYGPDVDESLMDEASATFYLKTDGSAYFGGSLLAGVLRTTATTTDTSVTASVQIGDFSSNGNDIQSFISYSYLHEFECDHGTGAIGAGGAAQIILEGSDTSGVGWATLATLNLVPTKTVIVDGDPAVKDIVIQRYDGSSTVVWTPGALSTLRLRGTVVSRTEGAMSGTGIVGNTITQTVTVSSTEQP